MRREQVASRWMQANACCWMGRRLLMRRTRRILRLLHRAQVDDMKLNHSSTGSEAARIAELLQRAFDGSAWHGPAVLELLEDVDAATAAARPLPRVHSIWELVLHIAVWDDAAVRRLGGKKWQPTGLANF